MARVGDVSERGRFISFEGIDRSGKSTQAALLAEALGADRALLVREPGGTEFSELARTILKNPELALTARAEALLFAAARADLVERVIEPALASGRHVIADRFIDSSLAYQGAARGLGGAAVFNVNEWAAGGLLPELTVLIDVDAATAAARGAEEHDRFEDEGKRFQELVAAAYGTLAQLHPDRIVRIDGVRTPEEIQADVRELIADRTALQLG